MPPKYYKKGKKLGGPVKSFDSTIASTVEYIVIVESPSKCKKIEEYLGPKYKCIATKGHIYTIPGLKSIDKKNKYNIKYEKIKEKVSHIESMRTVINKFPVSNIIIASDDDREGTGIAYNICQEFSLPVDITKRIIFHEITYNAIQHAIQNPQCIDINMVKAQQARQILDLIVGFKISPLLWKFLYFDKDNSLSAGRCQTPALRLVYDNYMDKKKSILEQKYKISATFFSQNVLFELEDREHEINSNVKIEHFLEESKVYNHILSIKPSTETYRGSPKPFNTSTLLQVASNQLGYSPKQTINYCQKLYQNGYITYMRTENNKYSENFLDEAKTFIENKWGEKYVGDLDKIANKSNSNPHEAIRVTHLDVNCIDNKETICSDNDENDNDIENKDNIKQSGNMNTLYKLIWRNTIESCMNEAKYKTTKIHISAPLHKDYVHTINIPIHLGWKVINNSKEEKDEQCSQTSQLFFLESLVKTNKPVIFNRINAVISFCSKHTHYTESSLIKKLEDLKIGRPSTFSTLVETIQTRGYITKMNIEGDKTKNIEYVLENGKVNKTETEKSVGEEKNKLVIQPLGIATIEFLTQYFQSIFCYDYTKKMEDQLDAIACPKIGEDNTEWYNICEECYNEIEKSTKPISKQKYSIDEQHELVFQKFGPVIKVINQSNDSIKDDDAKGEYKSVKKNIKLDLDKLCKGEYTLDELLEPTNITLGLWKGVDVYLKTGQYGNYIEYNDKRQNIKNVGKDLEKIMLSDVEVYLKIMDQPEIVSECKDDNMVKIYQNVHNKNILRTLNKDFSVRSGKFGPYVFYKKEGMHKPQFLNIRDFKEGFSVCDVNVLLEWLYMKYKIPRH